MQKIVTDFHEDQKRSKIFFRSILSGIGWAFGVTIGFAIITTILVFFLSNLKGLPVIGQYLSDLVEVTLENLTRRSVF